MKEGDKYDLNPFSTMAIKKKKIQRGGIFSRYIGAPHHTSVQPASRKWLYVCDLPPDSSAGGVDIFEGESGVRRMGNSALCLFDSYS